jgi:hypothetical protein
MVVDEAAVPTRRAVGSRERTMANAFAWSNSRAHEVLHALARDGLIAGEWPRACGTCSSLLLEPFPVNRIEAQ